MASLQPCFEALAKLRALPHQKGFAELQLAVRALHFIRVPRLLKQSAILRASDE
jgi:hypothetical protein